MSPISRPLPTTSDPERPPSLAGRVRTTALALGVLGVITALAVAGVSAGATTGDPLAGPDDHDHAAAVAPLVDEGTPPPPAPGEEVGVLDLFGRPLLGPDGQPLRVPLRPPGPRLPANPDEVYVGDGAPAVTTEVDLLTAHAVTLNEVANDERYTLVQRFDLFAANGLITAAPGHPGGDAAYRALLAELDQAASSAQPALACPTAASAVGSSDTVPDDLVAGLAVEQLRAEVERFREVAGCP